MMLERMMALTFPRALVAVRLPGSHRYHGQMLKRAGAYFCMRLPRCLTLLLSALLLSYELFMREALGSASPPGFS